MGYLVKFLGICAICLFGLQYVESGTQTSCATPQKIADVNSNVTDFQTQLDEILNSGMGTLIERYEKVFNLSCVDPTYRARIDNIAYDVSICFDLLATTNITQLKIGPITFMDVLSLFPIGGVAEFCDCSPFMPTALALAPMNASYSVVVPNGEYPRVGNLPFYCMESMTVGAETFNIRQMLSTALVGLNTTCEAVNDLAAMSHNLAVSIRDFLPMCTTFDPAKFQCALTNSASNEFKTCINNAVGEEADCKKYECVKTHIGADDKCGSMADKYFILAVNYDSDTAILRETECDTSAGTVYLASISTLLASVLLFIFL